MFGLYARPLTHVERGTDADKAVGGARGSPRAPPWEPYCLRSSKRYDPQFL
jgi:hypothetical protein